MAEYKDNETLSAYVSEIISEIEEDRKDKTKYIRKNRKPLYRPDIIKKEDGDGSESSK